MEEPLAQLVEHLTFNQRVRGSNPLWLITIFLKCGSSSVVEHHLAKVGVAGSNPVFRSINDIAGVAELADAQDLKSCGERSPYRFDSGPRHHFSARSSIG